MQVSAESFDYVIVGAGSAGCVLADRLSEDARSSVLLLEYGGSDRSLWIQMPTALSIPMNMERYDWRYYTEPEPHLQPVQPLLQQRLPQPHQPNLPAARNRNIYIFDNKPGHVAGFFCLGCSVVFCMQGITDTGTAFSDLFKTLNTQ